MSPSPGANINDKHIGHQPAMIWWDRHVQIPADEPPPPAPVRQPSDEDMEMDRERDISRSRKKRDRGTDEAL